MVLSASRFIYLHRVWLDTQSGAFSIWSARSCRTVVATHVHRSVLGRETIAEDVILGVASQVSVDLTTLLLGLPAVRAAAVNREGRSVLSNS